MYNYTWPLHYTNLKNVHKLHWFPSYSLLTLALFVAVPTVGESSSSSCAPGQDDEEQEQVIVTRTLASLNKANGGKMAHQKEKQQNNNRTSSRRSYPRPNTSFYISHLQNQAYPSVPPDQAMYHMWHRVQTTHATPRFPLVPTMGSMRFPPPAAMLSMYPPSQGQFAIPASQDTAGLLPCFPETAPVLPRYFSPYPISYVPRSPLPSTVHRNHGKMQASTKTVELPDAAVFSLYTSADSSCTPAYTGPCKVQELPKHGEDCTESNASPEEENKALLSASSATHPPSQKLQPNEDKGPSDSVHAESKKAQELSKISLSWGSSVPSCGSVKQKHDSVTVQHDELMHRNNHSQTSLSLLPELWSSRLQSGTQFGPAVPVNSLGSAYQQRPPWLAAPVTVRTAVPVCSARPSVVNTVAGATRVRPNFQNHLDRGRGEMEPHNNNDERNPSSSGTESLDLSKLHI